MTEHNRKAVVAQSGRSITVLGKDGREWRLCPASFCTWAAENPNRRGLIGSGDTIWQAIKDAERINKGEKK